MVRVLCWFGVGLAAWIGVEWVAIVRQGEADHYRRMLARARE